MTIELKTEVVKYTAEHAGCQIEINRCSTGWMTSVSQAAPWCYASMSLPTKEAAEAVAVVVAEAFAGVQV
jgi:hypothetical protein